MRLILPAFPPRTSLTCIFKLCHRALLKYHLPSLKLSRGAVPATGAAHAWRAGHAAAGQA